MRTFPADMLDEKSVSNLANDIKAVCPDIKLLVIDTLARSFGKSDENSAQAMNGFVDACDRLKRDLPGHPGVLVVHHSGKNPEKGARGSSALKGALDTMIEVSRKKGSKELIVKCEKQKDAEGFKDMVYQTTVVNATTERTALVLKGRMWVPANQVTATPNRSKPNEDLVLTKIKDAGAQGATWSELQETVSKSSLSGVLRRLTAQGAIERQADTKRYTLVQGVQSSAYSTSSALEPEPNNVSSTTSLIEEHGHD